MNKILLIESIRQSNLHPTTKSFLGQVLKNVSAEEDAAWAHRQKQIDAKKQNEMEKAYQMVEDPYYQPRVKDNYTDSDGNWISVRENVADPDVWRSADDSDIELSSRINPYDMSGTYNQMATADNDSRGVGHYLDFGDEWEGDSRYATEDDDIPQRKNGY